MKRIIAFIMALVLVLSGCSSSSTTGVSSETVLDNTTAAYFKTPALMEDQASIKATEAIAEEKPQTIAEEVDPEPIDSKVPAPEPIFSNLNDPALLNYVEKTVYLDVSKQLGEGYQVENVSAAYISKEYLEELTYNSQANVFFGYSLADLDGQFQGTRYIFTLGDNGETTVVPFEAYDDTYERVLKNVAIGTGVILVCVTVSVVTGGAGAPAVSMIFMASAKSGAVYAASSGAISGIIAGTVTGIQTKDFDQALKAGALAGSESFKWGAISGSILGGGSELVMLKTAARGGLTLDEAAIIIKETGLPANFVQQIRSMDEYYELLKIAETSGLTIQDMSAICMATGYPLDIVKLFKSTEESVIYFEQAGLYSETINGQAALIRSIDLSYESELAGKTVTNLERMQQGYAAIDPASGQAFQLHHIGQNVDSPLAILSQYEHTGGGNNLILHDVNIADGTGVHSLISEADWTTQREEFWEALAILLAE